METRFPGVRASSSAARTICRYRASVGDIADRPGEPPSAHRRARAPDGTRQVPIAAAVLRPTARRECAMPGRRDSCARTAAACSAFVTTQRLRGGKRGARRSAVCAQHRVAADDVQELFRRTHAAARPEARAAPAGKKHGASRKLFRLRLHLCTN